MSDSELDWGDDDVGEEEKGGEDDWGDMVEVDAAEEAMSTKHSVGDQDPSSLSSWAKPLDETFIFSSAAFTVIPNRAVPEGVLTGSKAPFDEAIFTASVPGVASMRSQTRDSRPVLSMLEGIFQHGLSTLGRSINQQIMTAFRGTINIAKSLPPKGAKRVSVLTALAESMMDCQTVQAREILRVFGDLTNQNQTFEIQIKYLLLKSKENALDSFITQFHKDCDKDHTVVQPWQQRAHLKSGYLVMLGRMFGLEGVDAAQGDRFVGEAQKQIRAGVWGDCEVKVVFKMLCNQLSVEAFVQNMLSDINNQSKSAERLINHLCIFDWAKRELSEKDAHSVFYDEERASEYKHQNPQQPSDEFAFNPFLSKKLVVNILVQMGLIERK